MNTNLLFNPAPEATVPKTLRPWIMLKGVETQITPETLICILKRQNPAINDKMEEDDDIKLCFIRRNRRSPEIRYNVVFDVSPPVYKAMMEARHLNVNRERLRVCEFSAFTQCFLCLKFGHSNNNCVSEIRRCSHCAGLNHTYESCPVKGDESKLKCFNCAQRNERTGLHVDVRHAGTSALYCPQIQEMKRRIWERTDFGS